MRKPANLYFFKRKPIVPTCREHQLTKSPSNLDKEPAKVYNKNHQSRIIYLSRAPSCVSKSESKVRQSESGGDAYVIMALRKDGVAIRED